MILVRNGIRDKGAVKGNWDLEPNYKGILEL